MTAETALSMFTGVVSSDQHISFDIGEEAVLLSIRDEGVLRSQSRCGQRMAPVAQPLDAERCL